MKRFISVGSLLALVLGLVARSFASDVERVALPASEMRKMEVSLGGLPPKDACWIWMDQLGPQVWANQADWFDSCCVFKKYVDPDLAFTDCLPPYFPFNVESMKIALHTFNALDTVQLIFDWDIEDVAAWDSTMGCYRPGVEIWRSEPMVISLPPDWYGWVDVTFPVVWVWGPFFISWHLLSHPPYPGFGWLTDMVPSTICWNWINYGCVGDTNWYEWVYDLGYPWDDGNLLFRVGGYPKGPYVTVIYPNDGETLTDSTTITWTAIDPDSGETALLMVDLDYSDNAGATWSAIDSNQTNTGSYLWDFSRLPDGNNYLVSITATDTTGRSDTDVSDTVFIINNPAPPEAISNLTATLVDSTIHLSWSEVTMDEEGESIVVDHYSIYRQSNPNFLPAPADSIGSSTVASYDDPTPALKDPGINHYYVVKAVDSMGRKSADSNRVGEFDRSFIQ